MNSIPVGNLTVWTDPVADRLMVGNAAAAALEAPRSGMPPGRAAALPPLVPCQESLIPVGTFGQEAPFLLRVSHPALAVQYAELLAPARSESTPVRTVDYAIGEDRRHAMWVDGALVASGQLSTGPDKIGLGFNPIFEIVLQLVSGRPVQAVLHGSAVRWKDRTLAFLGVSGSGKSTLAAMLCARGGRYLSDDYIALAHPTGEVLRVPLAPGVKAGSWPILSEAYPGLHKAQVFTKGPLNLKYLPGAPFSRRASVAAPDCIVFPKFVANGTPALVRLTLEEAILHLARAGAWVPLDMVEAFIDVLRDTDVYALRHTTDLVQTVALLTHLAASETLT